MMRLFARKQAHHQEGADVRLFRYPLEPCPKVTVICDTLRVPAGCAQIAQRDLVDLQKLRADALAAPASVLVELCNGWMPRFPLVAFTGTRHGFLAENDRDRLWRRFAVPVFEQLIDDEGRIIAFECEAHAGLHVSESVSYTISDGELFVSGAPSGIAARDVTGLCGCGRIGPRLFQVRPAMRLVGTAD